MLFLPIIMLVQIYTRISTDKKTQLVLYIVNQIVQNKLENKKIRIKEVFRGAKKKNFSK